MNKFLFFSLALSSLVFGQALDFQQLESLLSDVNTKNISSGIQDQEADYEGFTLNEYGNVLNQITKVDKKIEQDFIFAELQKKKIELASKLCAEDENACFLIENYRNSKSNVIHEKINSEDLILYGTDLFSGFAIEETLLEDLPIDQDYKFKIGDLLNVLIVGTINLDDQIQIGTDGFLSIPEVGRIKVAGLTSSEANKSFNDFVNNRSLGSDTYLYPSKITPNRVFALGSLKNPNSYSLNSRGSLINLIIASGGFLNNSSLRTISIISDGAEQTIDLYELLIFGKGANKLTINSGDTVLVNGIRSQIKVFGEVNRPAVYEIIQGDTIQDALNFSLGFTPIADKQRIVLKQKDKNGNFIVKNITQDDFSTELTPGDEIIVNKNQSNILNFVDFIGSVKTPGYRALDGPKKLNDFFDPTLDLLDDAYPGIAFILRYMQDGNTYEVISFNPRNQSDLSLSLNPLDKIIFLSWQDIKFLNSEVLKIFFTESSLLNHQFISNDKSNPNPIEEEYKLKANNTNNLSSFGSVESFKCLPELNLYSDSYLYEKMQNKISLFKSSNYDACPDIFNEFPSLLPILITRSIPVFGAVRNPGLYPVTQSLAASNLLGLSGGTLYNNKELIFEVGHSNDSFKKVSLNELNSTNNINYLNAFIEKREQSNLVKLVGEFKFPGEFIIGETTTLSEIYERAGGLLPSAYKSAGILTRESVQKRENESLKKAEMELANILSTAILSGSIKQSSTDILPLFELLTQVGRTESSGRVLLETDPNIIKNNPSLDTVLQPGDVIYMPKRQSTITVAGKVLNPSTISYNSKWRPKDYIRAAGGLSSVADESKIYVLLPNGEAKSIQDSTSFLGRNELELMPGSTIIVPMETRPLGGLALVEVLTPILANLSITAASINAISN